MGMALVQGQKLDKATPNGMKYELEEDWPEPSLKTNMGQPSGLGLDREGNLIVFHRADAIDASNPNRLISKNTILKIDIESGKVLKEWGNGLFVWPHGLNVDKKGNIWVTDVGQHQVFKFDANGVMLMKLGIAGEPGSDAMHFDKPTDVAVAEDGSFYVSDGYGNSRVLKFSSTGEFLLQWGEKGTGPGQFNIPHSIDLDGDGNVIVADRENARIQKFDSKGNFLQEWKNVAGSNLYAVKVDPDKGNIFAVDYRVEAESNQILGSNIIQFDDGFHVVDQQGRSGSYNGPVCRYHDIEVDQAGNVYVVDLLENRIQKFKSKH
jgi:peptidylamidoglycolate lyase